MVNTFYFLTHKIIRIAFLVYPISLNDKMFIFNENVIPVVPMKMLIDWCLTPTLKILKV
jgi:hypothetical protein